MKLNKKFIAIPAIALAAGLGLAACGGGDGASGYNNPATLAQSVKAEAATVGVHATQVICEPVGGANSRQFTCNVEAPNGGNVSITVAQDGQSWVNNGYTGGK